METPDQTPDQMTNPTQNQTVNQTKDQEEQPPSYEPHDSNNSAGSIPRPDSSTLLTILIRLFHNKPCKAPMDPSTDHMVWTEETIIRWIDEVVFIPPARGTPNTLRSLSPVIRERIEQRFTIDANYEDLYMFLILKTGQDRWGHRAPRILVHRGNEDEIWQLLIRKEDVQLQVWFGELKTELFANKAGKLSTRKVHLSSAAERLDLLSSSSSSSHPSSSSAAGRPSDTKEGFWRLGL